MEGYSVTEAASVLGVPTERVWELLARGVLSGVPDGETGMRVFLQPRPAPPAVEEPRRSNGGSSAREPEAEASPFRELLSEFRNLTERYGQALLALGESRGEVASLRSRVDLLEARFDLRLPMSGPSTAQPSAAAGWNAQRAPEPTVEPIPAEDAAGASPDQEAAEPSPPRRRRRGQHRATDDFAEALARAEDPSPAELPGGEEAAAAFAALRDEAAHRTAEHADAALPRELPAAEPIAIIEPDEIAEAAPQPVAEAEVAAEETHEPITAVEEVEVPPAPVAEAPTLEPETVDAEPQPIIEELAAAAIEADAIVDVAPEPIEDLQEPPTPEPEPRAEGRAVEAETEDAEPKPIVEEPVARAIEEAWEPTTVVSAAVAETDDAEPQPIFEEPAAPAAALDAEAVPAPIEEAKQQPTAAGPESAFDGLLLESDPEAAEPWFEPEPAGGSEMAADTEPTSDAETFKEPSSAEAEPADAPPQQAAVAPAASVAKTVDEPVDALAAAADFIEGEPEAAVEAASEPPVDESEPVSADEADEPEEPAEAEPASAWGDAAEAAPGLETEVEDAESSWDRDRYTARIDEPDWIPEERSPEAAVTSSPEIERPIAEARHSESESERSGAEPASDEPPWVGDPGGSTPTGEETMMWFGREPNRAAPAWPTEDDSAAEMEVASTGGHATRPRPVTDDPIAFHQVPAGPPAQLPDIRAEYRASLRPQPPNPASRAYRRLRRIFPG